MKLLVVANGQMPAAAAMIKDFDLTKLPSLPHTHKDHTRREETRIKYHSQNEANNEKRNLITYEYWTDLYAVVKASTENTAPVLSQEIEKACDLSLPANGGPRWTRGAMPPPDRQGRYAVPVHQMISMDPARLDSWALGEQFAASVPKPL